jgi:signal transduction histidine kinase
VHDAIALVDTLLDRMHDLAMDLRPGALDVLGLSPALAQAAQRFQARAAIATTVRLPDPAVTLAPDVATALFRIFQECLTNVARHAGATQVEAMLTAADGWVTLRVQDNGRGITAAERDAPAGLGLLGMHERAALVGGEVCVTGTPGHGTLVTARLPQHGRSDSMVPPWAHSA